MFSKDGCWRRRSGLALLALGVMLVGLGMARPPSELVVRGLRIVDGRGVTRSMIVVDDEDGSCQINVMRRDGTLAGAMGVSPDGSSYLGLYDRKNGQPDVRAYLMLDQEDGKHRPVITLLGPDNEVLFRVPR